MLNLMLYTRVRNIALYLGGVPAPSGQRGGGKEFPFPSYGVGLPAEFGADLGGQGWHRLGRGYYLPSCTSLFINMPIVLPIFAYFIV